MSEQKRMTWSHWLVLAAALMALILPTGFAAAQGNTNVQQVTYTATEYAFNGPDKISAGLVQITLVNAGKEQHHLQLVRLHEGKTMDDLKQALQAPDPTAAFAFVDLMGGVAITVPGQRNTDILNLPAGNYAMLCFISDDEAPHLPHFAKGMIMALQVTGNAPQNESLPQADIKVSAADFKFTMPTQVKTGQQTWQFVNNGPQPHEMGFMKILPGKTMADVQTFMGQENPSGPPPVEPVGGFQAMNKGQTAWAAFNFQPGEYLAVCFVPDPKTGKSHAELGMVTQFTVSAAGGQGNQGNGQMPQTLPVTGGDVAVFTLAASAGLVILAGWALRRRADRA